MGPFDAVDWRAVFVPKTPLLEIVVRGTVVYLALFAMLRFILKRQSGTVGVTDLLVVVLIADAAQNAMAGEYRSVPDGILLVAVIIGWSYVLDWLGYQFPLVGRIVHPPPLDLIRDGKLLRKNLRTEFITKEELMSQLREQGIGSITEVKSARMEGDGHISVVKHTEEQHPAPKRTNG
jgi:uncharacterized membrane protein YcaP (DUF421 family)